MLIKRRSSRKRVLWDEEARFLRPPHLPHGQRIYAIGDVHGRADLLRRMLQAITTDIAARPVSNPLTICLGDYVDRGAESREVIELLISASRSTNLVCLKGNHEQLMLSIVGGEQSRASSWMRMGAAETLRSYGVGAAPLRDRSSRVEACSRLVASLPHAHLAFLQALQPSATFGDYFFCHAGVRPGVPLTQQAEEDLLWIRGKFLECDDEHGKVIVHGHTPVQSPDVRSNRINIDTGAYLTDRLTCLVLEEAERFFLFT
jgi:serine/threonine protein phosphatase 1